ncbi:hypothetical protein PG985_010122 [Apiospora marii]
MPTAPILTTRRTLISFIAELAVGLLLLRQGKDLIPIHPTNHTGLLSRQHASTESPTISGVDHDSASTRTALGPTTPEAGRFPINIRARRAGPRGLNLHVHWGDQNPPAESPPAAAAAVAAAPPPPAARQSRIIYIASQASVPMIMTNPPYAAAPMYDLG